MQSNWAQTAISALKDCVQSKGCMQSSGASMPGTAMGTVPRDSSNVGNY